MHVGKQPVHTSYSNMAVHIVTGNWRSLNFFLRKKRCWYLAQGSYRKVLRQKEITSKPLSTPLTKTTTKTYRRRATAATPHMPWIWSSPSADGKSTKLGPGGPPSSTRRSQRPAPHHQIVSDLWDPWSAVPRTSARDCRTQQLRRAPSTRKTEDQQRSSSGLSYRGNDCWNWHAFTKYEAFFSIAIKIYSTSKSVLRTIAMSLKGIPYFDLIILGNI
jgi:hypothetical protein